MAHKQHQRHNEILQRLASGELLSITELAQEWKTTTKTLQRDFSKLMEGSYGVVRAKDGKRFVMEGRGMGRSDAMTTIGMLESLSADIGGAFYVRAQTLLHRLQRTIKSPFYTRIDVEDISAKLGIIERLEEAIVTQRKVRFRYKRWYKPDEVKCYEEVEPYKIIIFDGFWYLLTRYKNHTIKFYLREIMHLELLEEHFTPDRDLLTRMNRAINIWFDPDVEPFEVTLLLDSNIITYWERKPIQGQQLIKQSDGTAVLTLEITHKKELFYILKKWLPHIKVIEPEELQEEFEGMLREYMERV